MIKALIATEEKLLRASQHFVYSPIMSEDVRALSPQIMWNHFADLNAVPRPSKKEERVIAFMVDLAKN